MVISIDICCTGSVASIKMPLLAVQLSSELRKHGMTFRLRLYPTDKSTHFFDPLSLPNEVELALLENAPLQNYKCDLLLIAPLDANTLAELYNCVASGSDASTSKMAQFVGKRWFKNCWETLSTSTPTIIAPAMNTHMWHHPLTIQHCNGILSSACVQNVHFLPTVEKKLMCGDVGFGAMAEVDTIVKAAMACVLEHDPTKYAFSILSSLGLVPCIPMFDAADFSDENGKNAVLCFLDDHIDQNKVLHALLEFQNFINSSEYVTSSIACSPDTALCINALSTPELSSVLSNIITDKDEWDSWKNRGDAVLHVELARDSDVLFVISSPAAARTYVLEGRCPTLASCIVRAWQLIKPHFYIPILDDNDSIQPVDQNRQQEISDITQRLQQELNYVIVKKQTGEL